MQDTVSVLGLELGAPVGVYSFERGILQRLVIDVVVTCNLRPAAESDALADSLDYDRIAAICRTLSSARHHQLIETLAEEIALGVKSAFGDQVHGVEVRVEKPGAVADARTVAVTVRR